MMQSATALLIPAVATNPGRVSDVWEKRAYLRNWRVHLGAVRADSRGTDPMYVHEAAENAFTLASALTRDVAIPFDIDLTVSDVFALSLMIADDTVSG